MWRKKKDKAPEQSRPAVTGSVSTTTTAPPAYTPETSRPLTDLSTTFTTLTLSSSPTPTPDACLAHLRLLTALQRLKTETGYRSDLWEIHDSRAATANPSPANLKAADVGASAQLNEDILVKLREKRWAVYVARAADRYASWWASFVPDMLLERDMVDPGPGREDRYEGFTGSRPMVWNADMLPPLDVLMVWHAHMLNPRLYLEDCIRYGHGALWAGGMPWAVVNEAIDNAYGYTVSENCVSNWSSRTDLSWRNEDDPDTKTIKCPSCNAAVSIPWTTCGQPEGYTGPRRPGIVGQGLADGQLSHQCACSLTITHDALRAAKFRNDVQASITQDHAIPGTILDLKTGIPKRLKYDDTESDASGAGCPDRLFPARLARRGLIVEVVEMLKPGSAVSPSMMAVRDVMEENFTGRFADSKNLREVMDRHGHKKVTEFRLSLDGRRQTRKMMSRYWENASPLAIDLVGCVMRQGTFTEKMCKINWLHFPTARNLMTRLITKYERFIEIVAVAVSTKDKVAVPTIDVDLAWHTHQLSSKAYFDYTVAKMEAFVDHNDKVDEDKLSTAFEWTSKTYQEMYGEVYSECKCWYCETVRVMSLPATKMFGLSKDEKVLESWHASPQGKEAPIPPAQESAHVSSHPAVHTNETTARRAHTRPIRLNYRNRLEETHSKARKRTTKTFKADGGKRMGSRGEDTTPFWGKDIPIEGPYASSMAAAATSAMYPTPPGFVNTGPGSVGSCATGTCGGSGGCGSETLGLCSAGCVGSGWFGGKAGCTGFAQF
ncbi:alpha-ketoglutarate-dependent sulfonate dioxygenase [Colletotrichum plurivorum]|uniref:Alpha-ketoglutarate-dependent sulfonate dioxygenase n=1 Tax=Colletotrichum plurivorum TaxID=2175906 RepID=A0A8H6JTI1_9PEZI|nr:alpha-ketoglutarate-dependent sulfonate dioxygenase [Colletotrichum plurivorum]